MGPAALSDSDPAALLASWGAGFAAAAAVGPEGVRATWGDIRRPVRIASLSKLVVGFAGLIALEEGALSLADPAGPPGATVHDCFAHCSGLDFDTDAVLAPPRTRRIYSNTGWEAMVTALEAGAGMSWTTYVREAVVDALGMRATELAGSPARDVRADVADLTRFAGELLRPTLVAPTTLARAVTPQFPDLAGVLPGFGLQEPNPWGLGFEVRGHKVPHWTAPTNSPATFGHFGGSGTFLWVDPARDLALVALSDREFGPWAVDAWPRFGGAVIATLTSAMP